MAVALCVVGALGAQESEDLFVVNRQIVQVEDSPYGFRILYRGAALDEYELYIPTDWIFKDRVALVSYTRRKSAPYAQFFYAVDSGDLRFMRLVLPRSSTNRAWTFHVDADAANKFANAQFGVGQ